MTTTQSRGLSMTICSKDSRWSATSMMVTCIRSEAVQVCAEDSVQFNGSMSNMSQANVPDVHLNLGMYGACVCV